MAQEKKPIKDLFSFIINDLKEDVKFIARIIKRVKESDDENAPQIDWRKFKMNLKDILASAPYEIMKNWIWFLIIFLAFMSGIFVSSQTYQDKCNQFIQDTFYDESGFNYAMNIALHPEFENKSIDISKVEIDKENKIVGQSFR